MTAEILTTARLLLEKGGPEAISVREIARQVGVTPPAIYRYFPNLDALSGALREALMGELCDAMESARDRVAGLGPADRAHAMAKGFRDWAIGHPVSFRFALGLSTCLRTGGTPMARLFGLFHPKLASSPAGRPQPPAFELRWATLYGLVTLELSCNPEDLPEDIGQLYATALAGPW
jgi:AcrR family transcriptional regulator